MVAGCRELDRDGAQHDGDGGVVDEGRQRDRQQQHNGDTRQRLRYGQDGAERRGDHFGSPRRADRRADRDHRGEHDDDGPVEIGHRLADVQVVEERQHEHYAGERDIGPHHRGRGDAAGKDREGLPAQRECGRDGRRGERQTFAFLERLGDCGAIALQHQDVADRELQILEASLDAGRAHG